MTFSLKMSRKFSTTVPLMVRRLVKGSHSGIGYQITAIEDVAEVIKSDPEGFEGLESDLFNAHKSHKQHELNLKHQNEKITQFIIKKKYFRKETLPNLLTYAEKEQIKFLHSSDDEEWTIEKLAESFPASAATICKILKANWIPMSSKRIISHDAGVFKNWESFKKGAFSAHMDTELLEHLKKFVDREPNDFKNLKDPAKTFQKKVWQKPNSNEFSSIITSLRQNHNKIKDSTKLSDDKTKQKLVSNGDLDSNTYLIGDIKNKKPMTIHDLKNKRFLENIKQISLSNNSNRSLDQIAAEKLTNTSGTGVARDATNSTTPNSIAIDCTDKFITNEVVITEADRKRYEMSAAKGRIHIPRKLWKKGATYRTNDCYYDDDGEFLYRIPGMNSN